MFVPGYGYSLSDHNRCLDDVDDEVRDRAALYLKVFDEKPLADAYVKEGNYISLIEDCILSYL